MKPLKYREIIEILRRHGFEEDRVKGRHAQYRAVIDGVPRLVTVPTAQLGDMAAPGTFNSIVRQSGLGKHRFDKSGS